MNAEPIDPGAEAQPQGAQAPVSEPREEDMGLPRLVLETHQQLGPNATPEQVANALRGRGIETTAEEVRGLWPEGGNLTG